MANTPDMGAIRAALQRRTVALPDGRRVSQLGQGTWHMGEDRAAFDREFEALCTGVELGMTLIDTAEMYSAGRAERLVGNLVTRYGREPLTLVSKVLPQNAGSGALEQSLNKSLRRLGTDYLDLYLLHWHGTIPLSETVGRLEDMRRRGKILGWGVSNLDVPELHETLRAEGGEHCCVNQVLYHLGSRGAEFALLPELRERGIPLMAYSPVAQGGTLRHGLCSHPAVRQVADAHDATPLQILLAFVLHSNDVIAIPKAAQAEHVVENAAAALIELTEEEYQALSDAFPAPTRKVPLDIL